VQTFLPYADFKASAKCLDYRRLGKQRVEAMQIHKIVSGERTTGGWINHPAVNMWRGFANSLAYYYNEIVDEWVRRGYKNNMEYLICPPSITEPLWLGDKDFHDSHKSNLLRKDASFYGKYMWDVPDNLDCVWGTATQP